MDGWKMDGWIGLSGCGKWKWRVARFRISHMLSKFLREQRELPWQPNLGKISEIAHISFLCQKSRNVSHEQ